MIPPYIVLAYTSDDDSNSKRDREYEPEDYDDDILGAKELPGDNYIYYVSRKQIYIFAARLGQNEYDSIVEQIIIFDAVHKGCLSLHHIIDGYHEAIEKAISDYDIHRTKIKCYYIAK